MLLASILVLDLLGGVDDNNVSVLSSILALGVIEVS